VAAAVEAAVVGDVATLVEVVDFKSGAHSVSVQTTRILVWVCRLLECWCVALVGV
jgi:hypothetical protein